MSTLGCVTFSSLESGLFANDANRTLAGCYHGTQCCGDGPWESHDVSLGLLGLFL